MARRTGLTERTLRYYEERGLIDPPRQAGGHRVYDATTLARLYRVVLLRELGTPLGVLEYGARDLEGVLWSFMQPMEGTEDE